MPPAGTPHPPPPGGPVVFFDGVCGLCNGFVDFIIARDRRGRFRFSPLQGEAFAAAIASAGLAAGSSHAGSSVGEEDWMNSVVLWDSRGFHRKSEAALRVIASLGGFWKLAGVLRLIPRPLRDLVYDFIARNRYRWFGRREACRMPSSAERAKFLA